MKRMMKRLSEERDEAEMRAFYHGLGVRKSTTEAAIKVRLNIAEKQDKSPDSDRQGK